MHAQETTPRARGNGRTRAILRWSAAALAIHLVPLFLPRKEPEQELSLARLLPDAEHRIRLLEPLLQNPRSTPEDLQQAAELVLSASARLARQFLREAEARGADPVESELLRARICATESDDACVARALGRAKSASPHDPRPDLLEAELHRREGNSAGALTALQAAHDKAPNDVEITLELARALSAARRTPEAWTLIDRLPVPEPQRWIERGKLSLAAGEPRQAERCFAEAVQLEPLNAGGWYLLGVSLFQNGELARAEPVLRHSARLDARDFRPLALLCGLLREELRLEEAATVRMELLRRFPEREAEYTSACPN